MAAIYLGAFIYFDVPWARLGPGFMQLIWFVGEMFPPSPGGHLATYLNALGETLAISWLGTLTGALFALPLGVLAARNVIPSAWIRLPIKRFFDTVRGIDTLIWALIWINVVGLGPFAGVLAIATSDFGALAKLFAEIIESADKKELEGVRASGGQRIAEVRFGLLPQVLPVIAGQILYFIEFEHTFGDDHRRRRRRRHWPLSLRADPRPRMEAGVVPDPADSPFGGDDRLRLGQVARRDDGSARGERLNVTQNCHRTAPQRPYDDRNGSRRRNRRAQKGFGNSRPGAMRRARRAASAVVPQSRRARPETRRDWAGHASWPRWRRRRPFNLGEATVSRAVVELPSGERGYGHVLGRDVFHARAVAILDALWRREGARNIIETDVLAPIAKRLSATKRKADARDRRDARRFLHSCARRG